MTATAARRRRQQPLRLCRVVTVPFSFRTLLYRQLQDVAAAGIDLTLVASDGPEWDDIQHGIPATTHVVRMERRPAPAADLSAVTRLAGFFLRNRFDIVHSSTPKAGLLSALASTAARVPVRLHTFTGQPWEELAGTSRIIARAADQLTAALTTLNYVDSDSQRDMLVREGVGHSAKLVVLGDGSIAGVDLERFDPEAVRPKRRAIRAALGIPADAVVVVFVGRVTRDKGVTELVDAFCVLRDKHPVAHLLLVGPVEAGTSALSAGVLQAARDDSRIHCLGFQPEPEAYFAAADIFCLPSYREGFGTVAIEAAAMGLPAIATAVTGLVDSIQEGVTGLLVPAKDTGALAAALDRLLADAGERDRLGRAARDRARRKFAAERLNGLVIDEYFRLAHNH